MTVENDRPLGREEPTDWNHVELYELTPETLPTTPTPVVFGVRWYTAFDHPTKDASGRWWIGREASWGTVRGGHAICAKPYGVLDPDAWWSLYNQSPYGGACVGFSSSRMMSLLNRYRYDAPWIWEEAKKIDGLANTNPGDRGGTTVRAALDILRKRGHRRGAFGKGAPESLGEGISENRWATDPQTVIQTLTVGTTGGVTKSLGAIPLLNSWGRGYPHTVWIPGEACRRLLNEGGEAATITDRSTPTPPGPEVTKS